MVGRNVVDLADTFIISKFIIENAAQSDCKQVSFPNKHRNYGIEFVTKQDRQEEFIKKVQVLAQNIFSVFSRNNFNYNSLKYQTHNSDNKVVIFSVTGNVFNTYLAFGSIILYGVINNFDISTVFGDNISNKQ